MQNSVVKEAQSPLIPMKTGNLSDNSGMSFNNVADVGRITSS